MEPQRSLMKKGFDELKEMEHRKQAHRRKSLWNPPSSSRGTSSRASQAVKQFYTDQVEVRSSDILSLGYGPELDELQKSFMSRPGCPKYSHRATSTTHLDNGLDISFARIPPSNISTMSLSSQIPMDELHMLMRRSEFTESRPSLKLPTPGQQSDAQAAASSESPQQACLSLLQQPPSDFPASVSQSVPRIRQSYSKDVWSSGLPRSQSGARIPWYVTVLREKDMLLQKLGEEVSRLSRCENECSRKDDVISILREEVQGMQKQLDDIEQGAIIFPKQEAVPEQEPATPEPKESPAKEESPRGSPDDTKETGVKLHQRGVSLPAFFSQKSVPQEFREEMQRLKEELTRSDKVLDSKMVQLNKTLMKDQEELEELEKEYMEMQQKGMIKLGEEEEEFEAESKELFVGAEGFEEEQTKERSIHFMLLEFQRINQELYEELEKVKEDYDIATGAISSLQRQLSFEASQLRNAHTEQDLLRKELRERGNQLDAMSTKFSNLREERKHEEMMGSIERENHKLRQDVSDLELNLSEKSQMIEDLQTQVNRLQAELVVNQHQIGNQLTQQSDLQKQLDTLQRAEQVTRVTLEVIGARFERFRSKIIQATYSSPGTKSPQTEIADEEVLDALQKIISDRVDFHHLLKQKGVKVPPLNSTEPIIIPTHKKKSSSKQGLGSGTA